MSVTYTKTNVFFEFRASIYSNYQTSKRLLGLQYILKKINIII